MPRLYVFPFRYRNELTGKWVKARYLAEAHEIAARHAVWEIIGPPEIREVTEGASHFSPYRIVAHAELKRMEEPPPQINPHLEQPPAIDAMERFLVGLFLRRYVTYCARRRRYARMQDAARLYREVSKA
jgi:hypothetical protein